MQCYAENAYAEGTVRFAFGASWPGESGCSLLQRDRDLDRVRAAETATSCWGSRPTNSIPFSSSLRQTEHHSITMAGGDRRYCTAGRWLEACAERVTKEPIARAVFRALLSRDIEPTAPGPQPDPVSSAAPTALGGTQRSGTAESITSPTGRIAFEAAGVEPPWPNPLSPASSS